VTSKLRGAILVDPHTNSLMIQAVRSDMERLIPLIKELDRPTPQILIESHIVETTNSTARKLGVQWGGLHTHSLAPDKTYWVAPGGSSGVGVAPGASGEVVDPSSGYMFNFPANLSDEVGMLLGFVMEDFYGDILTVQLQALQDQGKLNILSSPSITTLDNQEAIIESGKDVPFQTVEDGEVNIEFKKAVLSLKVTPHVIDRRTLKLTVKTKNDELDFSNTVAGNPTITTKSAETNVVLFDGQTTVIGGLSKKKSSKGESGVPGLKDIPYLGYLFKNKSNENENEELLIFITPHILAGGLEKNMEK
jgi:type IV pilus assembly protein PilQ